MTEHNDTTAELAAAIDRALREAQLPAGGAVHTESVTIIAAPEPSEAESGAGLSTLDGADGD